MTAPLISLAAASLLALVYLVLLQRVVQLRHRQGIGFGDGGDPDLQRRLRVQGNFIEYVPLALLLIALLELSGFPRIGVIALAATLVIARVLHAIGLSATAGRSFGRYWGTALTWLVLLAAALSGLWVALLR